MRPPRLLSGRIGIPPHLSLPPFPFPALSLGHD
jgi:hypothetical protein